MKKPLQSGNTGANGTVYAGNVYRIRRGGIGGGEINKKPALTRVMGNCGKMKKNGKFQKKLH